MAVGAPSNDPNPMISAGHVRVYQWTNGAWLQLGDDIDGESSIDMSGFSVSLSGDGLRVAIGAYRNAGDDGNSANAGHVRVYSWNGTNAWVQLGGDIDGEAAGDYSGYSVSLSEDGSRVAIGAVFNDERGDASGHVRVYSWNGTNAWVQLGGDIDGEAPGDQSGYSVSMSGDGSRIAVGAIENRGHDGSTATEVCLLANEILELHRFPADRARAQGGRSVYQLAQPDRRLFGRRARASGQKHRSCEQ
jgi:hypothetical protein